VSKVLPKHSSADRFMFIGNMVKIPDRCILVAIEKLARGSPIASCRWLAVLSSCSQKVCWITQKHLQDGGANIMQMDSFFAL
jgi:hypothetical protein